jgi:hypothetical protein
LSTSETMSNEGIFGLRTVDWGSAFAKATADKLWIDQIPNHLRVTD